MNIPLRSITVCLVPNRKEAYLVKMLYYYRNAHLLVNFLKPFRYPQKLFILPCSDREGTAATAHSPRESAGMRSGILWPWTGLFLLLLLLWPSPEGWRLKRDGGRIESKRGSLPYNQGGWSWIDDKWFRSAHLKEPRSCTRKMDHTSQRSNVTAKHHQNNKQYNFGTIPDRKWPWSIRGILFWD